MRVALALAIAGILSGPALAQTQTQPASAAGQVQPAKPQVVKKRVCEKIEDEDPYSRLGTRTICRTIEVKVDQAAPATSGSTPQQPTPQQPTPPNAGR